MGEGLNQMLREVSASRAEAGDGMGAFSSVSEDYSDGYDSVSSDLTDDEEAASSAANYSANSSSSALHLDFNGPFYEISSLVSQLPIKKGLSKYYQGKSQSFTSLSHVRSVEDLAKKEVPLRRKLKSCKSYAGGLDEAQKAYYSQGPYKKATPKKGSRASSCSSMVASSNGNSSSFFCNGKPPSVPLQKNM